MDDILDICKKLALEHGEDVQCYKFHLLLKQEFPEATPYYNGNHVLTLIAGRLWDKTGLWAYPLESEPRMLRQLERAMIEREVNE